MKGAEDEGYSCFWKYNIYGSSHIFLFMHVHSAYALPQSAGQCWGGRYLPGYWMKFIRYTPEVTSEQMEEVENFLEENQP
mgnify:CR=1 FL=1